MFVDDLDFSRHARSPAFGDGNVRHVQPCGLEVIAIVEQLEAPT